MPLSSFASNNQIIATRIWPSIEYTRITIESNQSLKYKLISQSKNQIIISLLNIKNNKIIDSLPNLVRFNDPHIKSLKVIKNKNDIKLQVNLKQAIKSNIFTLQPISNFKNRLVIDLTAKNKITQELTEEDLIANLIADINKNDINNKDQELINKSTRKEKRFVVVIDPGHGGEDSGAIGYKKTKEKDITLQISKKLKALINKNKDMVAYMTREDDVFIPLATRVKKAKDFGADLFISIHADASTNRKAKGTSVYALSNNGATSSMANNLAKIENGSDLIGGVNLPIVNETNNFLASTILDLAFNVKRSNSFLLGDELIKELKKVNKMHKNTLEMAGFAVLKSPEIPAVLVETAFISNPEEEKKLKTYKFQNQLANSILKGIKKYIKIRKV